MSTLRDLVEKARAEERFPTDLRDWADELALCCADVVAYGRNRSHLDDEGILGGIFPHPTTCAFCDTIRNIIALEKLIGREYVA